MNLNTFILASGPPAVDADKALLPTVSTSGSFQKSAVGVRLPYGTLDNNPARCWCDDPKSFIRQTFVILNFFWFTTFNNTSSECTEYHRILRSNKGCLFYKFFSVQLTKKIIWDDDLLDPGTEEFKKRKEEVEEDVSE